jgi:hypothetical protein
MNLGKRHTIFFLLLFQVTAGLALAGSKTHTSNNNSMAGDSLNMKVLVPAYFDPSGSDYWDRMAAQAAKIPGLLYAIANPDNGPGSAYDTNYALAINKMHVNKGRVIGYVYTNYGAIPTATVKSDIDKWYAYYPSMDGIFLDCQDNVAGKEAYYIDIYNYIKQKDTSALVVSNPGTNTIENYLVYNGKRVSDVVCIFEVNSGFSSWNPTAWCSKYTSDNFYVIPYNTPASQYVNVVNRAHSLNMGWIYCTNDVLPNPYDTLPPYFENFCNYIVTGIYTPDTNTTTGNGVIKIDGSFDDWQNVTKLNSSPNPTGLSGSSDINADYTNFWATNDTANLYLCYQVGGSLSSSYYYHVFIDTDVNKNTGYIYLDSTSIGAEIMVENDNLWKYTGTGGSNWSWSSVSGFNKSDNGVRTEMSIPLKALFPTGIKDQIRIIFQINQSTSPFNLMQIDPPDYLNQYYSYKINNVTGVETTNKLSKPAFNLSQNYPNPFNPSTLINYQVPDQGMVTLKIYNVSFNSSEKGSLSSGIYFYQLKVDNYIETKKMVLLK